MAIIKPLNLPTKIEPGLGSQIGKMAAKGLLIDLPTAAIKTLAGIPFGDGKDDDSEEDKLLKKAIQSILSRQRMAASGGSTSAPYALPPVPDLAGSLTAPTLGSSV
jgi:hypothetical protein